MKQILSITTNILKGSLLSYAQIFFSKSYLLSYFLLFITFIFPNIAISGFLCTFSALLFASIFGLNKNAVSSGYYGYNALLVGLGLGSYYHLNITLFIILIFSGLLTLFIQLTFEGFFAKYKLPILSLPFLISIWLLQLASKNFSFLELSEHGLFVINNIFAIGGVKLINLYDFINNQVFSTPVKLYFNALSSIFFINSTIAGIIIFIGLLLFSRITTTLSIIGFTMAYIFLNYMGYEENNYFSFFVGFNFILTSIALGGVFIIPSIYSYLWIIILTPLVVIISIGSGTILNTWGLSVYSLPFNIITILFLYALTFRQKKHHFLALTPLQEYMPERNLYSYINKKKRFSSYYNVLLFPPFWGEWTVSQGYNGKYTHKEQYQYALDFVISINNKTYKNNGTNVEDYFSYNKQVVSPGYGYVVKIIDYVEDNPIGKVNTINNWGNTIIIKHSENLYSQISHLKQGSIKVKEGDYVYMGQPLALVGNSGRSPEPHLHFQVQSQPFVGSTPLEYPFTRYLLKNNHSYKLMLYSVPSEGDTISNIKINSSLKKAFFFIPLQQIDVIVTHKNKTRKYEWIINTSMLNETYIYCKTTNAIAYINNNGIHFQFLSYYGKKKNPLYLFYLSCYNIEFSELSQDDCINDNIPLHNIFNQLTLFFHDIIAPFYQFLNANYKLISIKTLGNTIEIKSTIEFSFLNKSYKKINTQIFIVNQSIENIIFETKKEKLFIKFINKNKYE